MSSVPQVLYHMLSTLTIPRNWVPSVEGTWLFLWDWVKGSALDEVSRFLLMYLACFCTLWFSIHSISIYRMDYQWSHLLLGRTYGKRPKNAQTHRPFLKPHTLQPHDFHRRARDNLLISRRLSLLEDFGPGLWGSGLSCPLQHLTINISLVKRLFHKLLLR